MNNSDSPFSKLAHIGLVIKDLDKTIAKLKEYGIGPFEHRQIPSDAEEIYMGKPMKATFRTAGADINGIDLELIQPVDGESPHMEFLKKCGDGVHHIGYAVDDVDAEVKKLEEKGATILLRATLPPVLKVAYIDLNAGGLIVELMQRL